MAFDSNVLDVTQLARGRLLVKLGLICKRTESTSNHYGSRKTEECCAIQLLILSVRAGYAENPQVLQKMCILSAGITAYLQVLIKMCIKSAGITEYLQKICRY